jgi:hypothetical protein|tara:strand:+ start:11903 stop:12172 length:270 start_codon:yes stop_codon:yes gene_type:complete
MSFAAIFVWSLTLVVVAIVIVPVAWTLLHRTLSYTRSIEQYASEMLTSGVGVAGNTANISALDQTIEKAVGIINATKQMKQLTKELSEK